jgi:hypothetical protein
MDISAIKTKLVTIQQGISGIKRAYANGPKALPGTDLPLFVNFVGPGARENPFGAGDIDHETRDFLMRLYVTPAQSGVDGEAEKTVEAFLPPVYAAFDAQQLFGAVPFVRSAVISGDSGIIVLPYAGAQYLGVEFRLTVRAFRVVTY